VHSFGHVNRVELNGKRRVGRSEKATFWVRAQKRAVPRNLRGTAQLFTNHRPLPTLLRYFPAWIEAWAAASRAIGTRNGEQLT
jgi:hypothetical protein